MYLERPKSEREASLDINPRCKTKLPLETEGSEHVQYPAVIIGEALVNIVDGHQKTFAMPCLSV